jgi:hypothetical protein
MDMDTSSEIDLTGDEHAQHRQLDLATIQVHDIEDNKQVVLYLHAMESMSMSCNGSQHQAKDPDSFDTVMLNQMVRDY